MGTSKVSRRHKISKRIRGKISGTPQRPRLADAEGIRPVREGRGQRVDVFAVLVHTGGQANRIGEIDPHDRYRIRRHRPGHQAGRSRCLEPVDASHADAVRGFGV